MQPTLVDVARGGRTIPAVVAMTRADHLFALDRLTGRPVPPTACRQACAIPAGHTALKPGPERALVQGTCTACHVAAQFTDQRHTREEWAALVEKMIGLGARVKDDRFTLIVDYLARHYPAGRQ